VKLQFKIAVSVNGITCFFKLNFGNKILITEKMNRFSGMRQMRLAFYGNVLCRKAKAKQKQKIWQDADNKLKYNSNLRVGYTKNHNMSAFTR
jgi:hypothetical protein